MSSGSDYEDLKPCCSMSSSWAASGITFDQTGNTGKDGTTGTSAGGGGGGGGDSRAGEWWKLMIVSLPMPPSRI